MKKPSYPVILCIGTPRVSGDSLGPKVGDLLKKFYNTPAYVYGTSDSPVTGVNYQKYTEHIKTFHPSCLLIAVDACMGSKEDVGKIKYSLSGLHAGTALKKELGTVGDIAFLGIVAEGGNDNFQTLSHTDKRFVEDLAVKIAEKIFLICARLRLSLG